MVHWLGALVYIFDWYLLQLIVLSWSILLATKTHFLDQFRSRLISQLVKKVLLYFSGTDS